jgi:diketogulonate reductase-like aldo/keto reductase
MKTAGSLAAVSAASSLVRGERPAAAKVAVPRRPYKDGIRISIVGLGGISLVGMKQEEANRLVAEAIDRQVNYVDIAPSYGKGEAEQKMGPALEPFRKDVFLACKTGERKAEGARRELEQSLKNLRTDHFDLYQLHGISKMEEVETVTSPGGALETLVNARESGLIRYIGFSAHLEEAALALCDRFAFDSVLFPVNFVCYSQGHFGPRLIAKAGEKGMRLLALKALALRPWTAADDRGSYPHCWYKPIDDPSLARKALRFTLGEGVTALIPPGDARMVRLAISLAGEIETPLTEGERQPLFQAARGIEPVFKTAPAL